MSMNFGSGVFESIKEGGDSLTLAVFNFVFSVIVSTMIQLFNQLGATEYVLWLLQPWKLYLATTAFMDFLGLFVIAQEALGGSISYILGRILGLIFAIWIVTITGFSATSLYLSFIVFIAVLTLRIVMGLQYGQSAIRGW